MQTFKSVIHCREERQNLKNIGICILTVITFTVAAFGIVHLKPFFQTSPHQPTVAL